MKRIILLSGILAWSVLNAIANPIDVKQAKRIARTTLLESVEHGARKLALAKTEMKVLAQDELQPSPAYFICQPSDGTGFVIVSGEDCEDAVLGYSTEGSIDISNMPPALHDILEGYSQHIAQVRKGETEPHAPLATSSDPRKAKSVSALCKSAWSQDAPFNNYCPTDDNGTHCLVGCVATSCAQIMYYHKYPDIGTGTVGTRYGNQQLELNLDTIPFYWDNMLDSYKTADYTKEQADAVAKLCQAIGYSVHMNYSPDFSGAYMSAALNALINNFYYSTTAKIYLRNSYSDDGWLNKLKTELEAGRPIMFVGYTASNDGHCFICDGFNFKNLVHINWGWADGYDGFFNVKILSPDKQKPENGYSHNQQIMMGIQPMQEGEDRSVQYQIILQDSITYTQNGNNFTMRLPGLTNESCAQASGAIHFVIFNADGKEADNIRLCDFNGPVDMRDRTKNIDFSIPAGLDDGEYCMQLAFKPNDSDKWFWLETGDLPSLFHLTITNGEAVSSDFTANGIADINKGVQDCAVFNLGGTQMNAGSLPKGLYISKGKKFIAR